MRGSFYYWAECRLVCYVRGSFHSWVECRQVTYVRGSFHYWAECRQVSYVRDSFHYWAEYRLVCYVRGTFPRSFHYWAECRLVCYMRGSFHYRLLHCPLVWTTYEVSAAVYFHYWAECRLFCYVRGSFHYWVECWLVFLNSKPVCILLSNNMRDSFHYWADYVGCYCWASIADWFAIWEEVFITEQNADSFSMWGVLLSFELAYFRFTDQPIFMCHYPDFCRITA